MKYWKEILALGIGGAVGFAAGWYFSKRRAEKRADEEIDSVKQYYMEKHLKETKKMEEINDKIEEKIFEVEEGYDATPMTPIPVKTQYNIVGDDEKVLAEKETPEEDEPTKPYLITEDEFLNDKNEYDKISLTYYTYDDMLADDCDEMIDIEETISTDIYNQIPDSEGDVYVRNPVLETDYEVMKVEASFHERYGGF